MVIDAEQCSVKTFSFFCEIKTNNKAPLKKFKKLEESLACHRDTRSLFSWSAKVLKYAVSHTCVYIYIYIFKIKKLIYK